MRCFCCWNGASFRIVTLLWVSSFCVSLIHFISFRNAFDAIHLGIKIHQFALHSKFGLNIVIRVRKTKSLSQFNKRVVRVKNSNNTCSLAHSFSFSVDAQKRRVRCNVRLSYSIKVARVPQSHSSQPWLPKAKMDGCIRSSHLS